MRRGRGLGGEGGGKVTRPGEGGPPGDLSVAGAGAEVAREVSVEAGVGGLRPGQEALRSRGDDSLAPVASCSGGLGDSCGSLPGGVLLAAPVQLPPEPLVQRAHGSLVASVHLMMHLVNVDLWRGPWRHTVGGG